MPRHQHFDRSAWLPHAAWTAVIVVLYLAAIFVAGQTEPTPGVCSGLGWGCEVSGSDAAGLAAVLLAGPGVTVLVVGYVVIAVVRRIWHRVR